MFLPSKRVLPRATYTLRVLIITTSKQNKTLNILKAGPARLLASFRPCKKMPPKQKGRTLQQLTCAPGAYHYPLAPESSQEKNLFTVTRTG